MIPGATGCSAPLPPPPVLGGGDDDNADWVARGLSSSDNGSIVASTLRWSSASLLPSGGDRGGVRRLAEALAGEEDKYRGWKVQGGLDEAQRRREEEEGESVGGRDRDGVPGASSGAAGDGEAWGPDDRASDAPPSRFGEGGLSSRPQTIIAYPWTAMARVGIRNRRVKELLVGIIYFEATPLLDSVTSCNFSDW